MTTEINQVIRNAIASVISLSGQKGVTLSEEICAVPSALSHWLHGKSTLSHQKVEALFRALGLRLGITNEEIFFLPDHDCVRSRKWVVPDPKKQLISDLLRLMPELSSPNKIHLSKQGGAALFDLTQTLPGDLYDPRGPLSLLLVMPEASIREIWARKCRIDFGADELFPMNPQSSSNRLREFWQARRSKGVTLTANPGLSPEDVDTHNSEHSDQEVPSVGDVLMRWGQSLLVAEQNEITPEIAEMLFRYYGKLTPEERLQIMKENF